IIWPVECIPYPLRYLSLALPQTYASESLRCIMYRGKVYAKIDPAAVNNMCEAQLHVNNLISDVIRNISMCLNHLSALSCV
ncbi:hypothetical protein GOODEAATRI_020904, partial [Goodea atripinnis]